MSEVSVCFCAMSLPRGRVLKVRLEKVSDSAGERESLDALRAPLGADLIAAHAPDLFRVGLEEGEVELAAEAVDEEVFETLFRPELMDARLEVAEADLRACGRGRVC